ncbi:MOSC domain-containing protein YiiM [Variovorax paradoxus]|uniref:MOSC domain-containing protein n=1 Tax=Variovorax paradoxus TaxID=34073 RepID=UPI00277D3FC3|nr:MOSC domain-containing protein [Variovorax paradoxus]MDQ0027340.1 MOSC domain-containing protein YiiM [Variovorax paradoxus]
MLSAATHQQQLGDREAVPAWTGVVRHLHITPRAFLPMESFDELTLVAGKGIEGDRYMIGRESGFYSHKPEEGRQITLFEIETLEALARDANIQMLPEEHRRNVTVQGVPLNHLVGRQFWVGETLLEATRLSTPCRHIEEILGKAVFDPLINRSGLNCRILKGGVIRVGDAVRGA